MRQITKPDLVEIDRILAARSLADFVKMAWPVLEPSTRLVWDWPLDAICSHLEAVSRGECKRLVMNVPPGSMKSLLTGVFWNAWEWGPLGKPYHRFIGTSYKQTLAVRDAMKARRLVKSEWFQERWPLRLMEDQDSKMAFGNSAMGFRTANAFNSMTGERGDRVVIDDPLSVAMAGSDADRETAKETFLEALPTRVNNDDSAIVIIMQRLHEEDTTGIILDRKLPYTHLMLPMRFEADRKCSTPWFTDPRTQDGELMMPERFPEATVAELERTLGSYGTAGQLQQRPAPRGGGMFQRVWFKEFLSEWPSDLVAAVRGWDLAATEDDPNAARTAGCLMGRRRGGQFVILHMVKGLYSARAVRDLIHQTAKMDAQRLPFVLGSIPQDPGQSGKAQAQDMILGLQGFNYRSSVESGDKVHRALPVSAQAEAGNIQILQGEWVSDFFDEIEIFPQGKRKDQVDALSRAYSELIKDRPGALMGTQG